MVKIETKSPLYKALRAAIYAGISGAAAFFALQVGADGTFAADRTFFIGLVAAFVNGVAVFIKNKFDA